MSNFSLQFSLHFGENFLVGPKRTPESHNLFSFLPTQPNTLQKVFLPIFSPKFFIHPIPPPNKHTLKLTLSFPQNQNPKLRFSHCRCRHHGLPPPWIAAIASFGFPLCIMQLILYLLLFSIENQTPYPMPR